MKVLQIIRKEFIKNQPLQESRFGLLHVNCRNREPGPSAQDAAPT